jgi:hypothetical protein
MRPRRGSARPIARGRAPEAGGSRARVRRRRGRNLRVGCERRCPREVWGARPQRGENDGPRRSALAPRPWIEREDRRTTRRRCRARWCDDLRGRGGGGQAKARPGRPTAGAAASDPTSHAWPGRDRERPRRTDRADPWNLRIRRGTGTSLPPAARTAETEEREPQDGRRRERPRRTGRAGQQRPRIRRGRRRTTGEAGTRDPRRRRRGAPRASRRARRTARRRPAAAPRRRPTAGRRGRRGHGRGA